MTEDKLEGFEDFDSLLGDAEEGGGELGGELDSLLGDADSGGGMDDGGGDSELDSFFEDLSTIDDLEVVDDGGDDEPAVVEDLEGDDDDDGEEFAAAPVAAAAAEPEAKKEKPKKEKTAKPPREPREPGKATRMIKIIVLVGLLLAGAYFLFMYFFPDGKPPEDWGMNEVQKRISEMRLENMLGGDGQKPPEPPPKPSMLAPPPKPPESAQPLVRATPQPKAKPKPRPKVVRGPGYSVQVATCFFPNCVRNYRDFLRANNLTFRTVKSYSRQEAVEIFSRTTILSQQEAVEQASRINEAHTLEGHAYIFKDGNGYRISMGAFPDLDRAKKVQDELNRNFGGEVIFTTRLKDFDYVLEKVVTGKFADRLSAERALQRMQTIDRRFHDAIVIKN